MPSMDVASATSHISHRTEPNPFLHCLQATEQHHHPSPLSRLRCKRLPSPYGVPLSHCTTRYAHSLMILRHNHIHHLAPPQKLDFTWRFRAPGWSLEPFARVSRSQSELRLLAAPDRLQTRCAALKSAGVSVSPMLSRGIQLVTLASSGQHVGAVALSEAPFVHATDAMARHPAAGGRRADRQWRLK
jgi:hypothetical protein